MAIHKMRSSFLSLGFILSYFILYTGNVEAQVSNMTITLNATGPCASETSFKKGSSCVFEMIIQVPINTPTMMHVELFTSDNSTMTMAQICKPTITIGQNYNLTIPPIPELSSSNDNYQFDQAVIDFGVITNLNTVPSNSDAHSIKITFNVVIIENTQPNGTSIWITAGAEYYDGNEIWIGQTSLTYVQDPEPTMSGSPTLTSTSPSSTAEIGKFGSFDAKLTIPNFRAPNVTLTAFSNDYINNSVTVCSIHIKSTGWCYHCVDSTKAYMKSKYSKEKNYVSFELGKIVNLGANNGSFALNSNIEIFVTYKISPNAKITDSGTIILTALVEATTLTYTHTVNLIASTAATLAPTPTVNQLVSSMSVLIYQSFNITLVIDFPQNYNHYFEVEAIPNQETPDGQPRAKICSVVITSSGENLPCPKCMNTGILNAQSQNSSLYSTYDAITWSMGAIQNYNLRTISDKLDVNKMTISIIGQLLNHSSNTEGSNISIPIGVTFGNQTIWVTENIITVSSLTNFSSTNESLPSFSISKADNGPYDAKIREPRAIYFDIYTKPGSIYRPMDIEVVMPETIVGSNIPAATVCSIKMHYVGIYSVCAQQSFVNNLENGKISYLQRMISFKNDKAIVKLDPLCNSADSSIEMDPIDGLVRFLIYFQLDDDPNVPSTNAISVGTKYTLDQIYVGSIQYTKSSLLPTASSNSLFSFTNSATLNAIGGSFSNADLIFKVQPSSLFGYSFEATLSSSLTQGKASLCTIRINKQGSNIPCSSPIKHSFKYNSDLKYYDFAIAGPICSINNISSSINSTNYWDDDSVSIEIVTRPTLDAVGSYSVTLKTQDQSSNFSLNSRSYIWTSIAGSSQPVTPNLTLTNSSIFGVNPNDTRYISVNSNYLSFYKGQTSIIRFNLTINEPKYYNMAFHISSSLPVNQYEILRIFVLNIGENFPCSSPSVKNSFTNGSIYTSAIRMDIGEIAYYALNPLNLTSSTITLEAHVRIPLSSNAPSNADFIISPLFNNNTYAELNKTLSVSVLPSNNLVSTASQLHTINLKEQTINALIRQSIVLNLTMNIPPNDNTQVKLNFSCVDTATNRQFCHIVSVSLISIGKNVDGLFNEYKNNLMLGSFSKKAPSATYYNDSYEIDLGIITNTNYGQKIENYNPLIDDVINFQAQILIIDDQISQTGSIFNFNSIANLNSNQLTPSSISNITIIRNGNERPYLLINVSFLNNTSNVIQNTKLFVKFEIEHALNSTSEAYNITVVFYFPKYVTFSAIEQLNSSFIPSQNDSAVIFTLDRLHFGQKIELVFSIVFDQLNKYSEYINQFGRNAPSNLKIPYNLIYNKILRSGDTNNKYNTQFDFIQFTPPIVSITTVPSSSLNPNQKITEPCRITSNIPYAPIPNNFNFDSEWRVGYRSYNWLRSHSTFITIAFVDQVKISKIVLGQLTNSNSDITFDKYRIGFSQDNIAFAHLPEVTTNTTFGQNLTYSVPNKFISCKYLRIYITDVKERQSLEIKQTGLKIKDIVGEFNILSTMTCPNSQNSAFYQPRSYLYVNPTLYVCDETLDRSASECYMSTDSLPNTWNILPKLVSTIVFYVKDLNSGKEYLYGIGKDKISYVRSDDNGITWKIVSKKEFDIMKANANLANLYQYVEYTNLAVSSLTPAVQGQWTFNVTGVLFNGILKFDWFN